MTLLNVQYMHMHTVLHTVQTLDLILLCTRCIPQMHFYIARKIDLRLLPCVKSNFSKKGNLAPSLKELCPLSVASGLTREQSSIQSGTFVPCSIFTSVVLVFLHY
jgi:hypothetical protein